MTDNPTNVINHLLARLHDVTTAQQTRITELEAQLAAATVPEDQVLVPTALYAAMKAAGILCLDEGCPHYGTPHSHPDTDAEPSLPERYPFDLARAQAGDALVTRNGQDVYQFTRGPAYHRTYSHIARIGDASATYTQEGKYYAGLEHELDLFMKYAPKAAVPPEERYPFDLERALAGEELVTRKGQAVEQFSNNDRANTIYPFLAVVTGMRGYSYTGQGHYVDHYTPHDLDLFMKHPPKESEYKPDDFKIDVFPLPKQPGFDLVTPVAVRVTHLVTGLTETSSTERSQHRNRVLAMAALVKRLKALTNKEV